VLFPTLLILKSQKLGKEGVISGIELSIVVRQLMYSSLLWSHTNLPLFIFLNDCVKLSFQKFRIYRFFSTTKIIKISDTACLGKNQFKSLLDESEGRRDIRAAVFHT